MLTNLTSYFENSVNLNKRKAAVIDAERSISFFKLSQKTKVLACEIIRITGKINKPIAVFLPKSIESTISDIAITYSGNIYMNIDIKSPQTRISNILKSVEPVLIITDNSNCQLISQLEFNCDVINLDTINFNDIIDEGLLNEVNNSIIDTDPYCIINTSGSTGTPKGVVLNQRSFIDFSEWAIETLQIEDNEIVGSLSPIVFDIYSFELCMLMTKGSTLVLIPEQSSAYPAVILDLLQKEKISFIFWVPTIMVNMANMDLLKHFELQELKTIWFAGEVFPTKQFNYWKNNLLHAKFVNLYGPIEITLDCTYFVVNRELKDEEPIPIGFPCHNTDILILNENNELVEKNEEGELCVRGSSLAMGYYNNPEKTADTFVQNPLNKNYPEIIYRTGDMVYRNNLGEIIFKGRKDSLVKHLGYRIELGEIEHVIVNTLKLVDNVCIVYNKNKKEITVIYESETEISVAKFRKTLTSVFPKYMVPTSYIHMTLLPRNTNGKIDRLALSKRIND